MAKFKLDPDPTFSADVHIRVPGKGRIPLRCQFRYMDEKTRLAKFSDRDDATMNDLVLDVLAGWELDEPCNAENIEKLRATYPNSLDDIFKKWADEIMPSRLGN